MYHKKERAILPENKPHVVFLTVQVIWFSLRG